MEQVIIHKPSGALIKLFAYNGARGITKAEQVCELLGQDVVSMTVVSAEPITFEIGDYVEIFGARYKMNSEAKDQKNGDRLFEYELKYEGPQYDLIKVLYLDIDEEGLSTGARFSLMGNLKDFAQLIINNAGRVYGESAWELGDCPEDTLTQNVQFSDYTCLQALQNICELYNVAFFIERTDITSYKLHLREPADIMDFVFKYGRNKGLYTLVRESVSGKTIINRLFAYGSSKNLPLNYRYGASALKMPITAIHSEGQPYIEDPVSVGRYGVFEGTISYDDIFPERTGTATNIDSTNPYVFYDSGMPFNLAETSGGTTTYLIPGLTAKINFKTGNLAGYQFDVSSEGGYIHATRRFKLLPYVDDRGMSFPSETESAFKIQIGDEYVITDIMMPASYISNAENRLLVKAEDYLAKNAFPQVQYSLTVDQFFIESHTPDGIIANYFKLGDYIKILDEDLRINGRAPIQAFTRDILSHYKYTLTLGQEFISRTGPIARLRAAVRADSLAVTRSESRYYSISTTVVEPERRLTWREIAW